MSSSSAATKLCWGAEAEIFMLDFYRDHEQLWNCKHQDYYDREIRDRTLSELAMKLGHDYNGVPYSVNDIKYKIKNLRATFGRELMKCSASRRNGRGAGRRYTPRWRHYHRMMFLRSSRKSRESKRHGIRRTTDTDTDTDTNTNTNIKEEELYSTDNDEILEELDEDEEQVEVDGDDDDDDDDDDDGDDGHRDPLDILCDIEIAEGPDETVNRLTETNASSSSVVSDPNRCLDIVHEDGDDVDEEDPEDVVSRKDIVLVDEPSADETGLVDDDHHHRHLRLQSSRRLCGPTTATSGRQRRRQESTDYCCPAAVSCRGHRGQPPEDSEYHFCMSLADNLRRMPPYQRESAKVEMQKVLMRFMFPVYKKADNEYRD